ncbi:MAG: energy-coupling factor transporter ATPase [Erysipelotrichaceae bacterium]|jgi:energy-coupling factor transport system ATP-binding protein|nr:energy-coupling factor transporter ATPase [Bacilli bacterium]NLV28717.1 energy-coupling factor transporter ATPase [Erysipelotrichaceae bacterium]HPY79639.1 energy-coupling factor transporter ATPase [Bacilli bacterium]HQA55721.1 energy-coupling factor transporter ATPase [Bacilli bacterium]
MEEIVVKNLSFSYDKTTPVLSDVSFTVRRGTHISIVGHNGSGKSTLAKLLIGLLESSSGEIYIDGTILNEKTINNLRGKMCLVFQNPDNQFIGSTVEDDIAFGLENKRVPQLEMKKIIAAFAEEVGMGKYLNKEPSMLSGGQKQRVAIAGALALSPDIIIFDEAASMLDPNGKLEILNVIKRMRKSNPDLTIISITHDVEEAFISDEVIVLSQGKVVMNGRPSDIFSNRDTLKKYKLEMPFILDLKEKLKSIEINVPVSENINEVVEAICQSK